MNNVSNREDLQWIQQTLQGDTNVFSHLAIKYKDFAYTLTFNLLKQKEEAEEAAQDAFMKAFQALPRFRQDAKFSTWFYRIVYNECVTRLRNRKIQLPMSESRDEQRLEDKSYAEETDLQARDEQHRKLHQAIRELPESDRAIVMLFYFEKLPVDDISTVTGLSVSNVKTKLFRARKKLYNSLLRLEAEADLPERRK